MAVRTAIRKDLYTPKELLKKYPNTRFTESDLGRFLRLDILTGEAKKRESLIEENSFIALIALINSNIDSKKISSFTKYQ